MNIRKKTILQITAAVFLLFLCIHYWDPFMVFLGTAIGAAYPLLIGTVIAYVLNILMGWFERRYFPKSKKKFVIASRRIVSILLAIFSLTVIVILVVCLVVPQLIDCFRIVINEIPPVMNKFIVQADQMGLLPEDVITALEKIDWHSRLEQIFTALTNGVGSVMDIVIKTVSSVFSGIVTTILAIIFALYLLFGKETIAGQCSRVMQRYLKQRWTDRILYVLRTLNDCFHKFIVGQCTEAVILGVLCAIGMWIFRFPYAAMISALIAFTALIPIAGAYIGGGIGTFMILTVSPIKALCFIIFLVILQQLEGNLIYPRVVGASIGLPGIWVLAAVTVFGGMMGVTGMLLGVPLTAALYRMLRDDVNRPGRVDKSENIPNNT